MLRPLLITAALLATGCTGIDPSLDAQGMGQPVERESLEASVKLGVSLRENVVAPPQEGDDSLEAGIYEPAAFESSLSDEIRSIPFVADEVIANLTVLSGQEQVVISGLSADRTRSLALVLDTRELTYSDGTVDLSRHGAVYMESGLFGGDLLFDGTPQGTLDWEGELEPGGSLSGSFNVIVPTYDRDGEGSSEVYVALQGHFDVHLLEDSSF